MWDRQYGMVIKMRFLFMLMGLVGLGLVLAFPVQADAAEYYVAPTGSDTNPGNLASPFKTISGNVWRLQPGDTMYLRAGVYTESITPIRSGQPQLPITFKAYQNEQPVLANVSGQAIYVYDKDYLTFDGIDIRDINGHWISIWLSSFVTIRNCSLSNVTANIMGFYIIHSNHITLQDCSMDKVSSNTVTQDKDLIHMENTHYSLLERLTLRRGPHSLIGMQNSTFNIIRNNDLHNEWQKNVGTAANSSGNTLGRNVFENNRIYSSRPAILQGYQGKGAMGIYLNQKGNIIRRNQIYDNSNFGILLDGNNALGNSSVNFNKIYHNTIVGNGKNEAYPQSAGISVTDFSSGITMGNNVFKNNILTDNRKQNIFQSYLNISTSPNTFEGNCETPTFVQPSLTNPDFHLNSTGCVDQGVALTQAVAAGSGTQIQVADSGYFSDGFGVAEGDPVSIGGQTAKITRIDYGSNTLTLDRSLTWTTGAKVTQAFAGVNPDPGVFESNADGSLLGGLLSSPSPTTSVVGDANGDQKVTGLDYVTWLKHSGQTSTNGVTDGDFNNDRLVNDQDYAQWLGNFTY
jgi:hypothetical protein